MPVTTVQEFRTQSLRVLDSYLEIDESKKKTIVYGIRFFNMLSTTKEIEDTADGKETRDMTRSQVVKGSHLEC